MNPRQLSNEPVGSVGDTNAAGNAVVRWEFSHWAPKIHICDWLESALLRFWHVGHKMGGTLTPDAMLSRTRLQCYIGGRSTASPVNVVGWLKATQAAPAGLKDVRVQPSQSSRFVGFAGLILLPCLLSQILGLDKCPTRGRHPENARTGETEGGKGLLSIAQALGRSLVHCRLVLPQQWQAGITTRMSRSRRPMHSDAEEINARNMISCSQSPDGRHSCP